jgi:hypothetical protein
MYFLTFVQNLIYDLAHAQGCKTYHYFPDSRTAILTLTIPEKIASLLYHPEKIAEYTLDSFGDIVRSFLEDPDFVQGKRSQFWFRAFKYDPDSRELLCLSTFFDLEKAYNLLKQLHSEP